MLPKGEPPGGQADALAPASGGFPARIRQMRDLYPDPKKEWKPKFGRVLLGADARIDSALFSAGRMLREVWERFSALMDRFHVAGWRRWVFVEPLSEAATMGCAGAVLMLGLALPA